MEEKEIINQIHEEYSKQLKNVSVPHNKLVICFSGIPGSGKTHISKILEKRYKGVRIRGDSIRQIVKNLGLEIDKYTYNYLEWLDYNYSFKNKLMILDGGMDRRYRRTFQVLKNNGYRIFIIRLKASKEKAQERVFAMHGGYEQHFVDNIDRWIMENKEFGKNVKPDIEIENENKLNLKPLFLKLDKLIN